MKTVDVVGVRWQRPISLSLCCVGPWERECMSNQQQELYPVGGLSCVTSSLMELLPGYQGCDLSVQEVKLSPF